MRLWEYVYVCVGCSKQVSGCLYCPQLFQKFHGRSGHACQTEAAQIPPEILREPEPGMGLGLPVKYTYIRIPDCSCECTSCRWVSR